MNAWLPFAAVCTLALGRLLTAPAPELAPESDDELLRRLFRTVASEETKMRHDAAKTFPTDLWSRDDDFHQHEGRKAREFAGSHHMRLRDAYWAMDEGLRAHWPQDNPEPLVTTVAPCRPRAIY